MTVYSAQVSLMVSWLGKQLRNGGVGNLVWWERVRSDAENLLSLSNDTSVVSSLMIIG
jgi:hypothetical protein